MLFANNHPIDNETIETEFKRLMRLAARKMTSGDLEKQSSAMRQQAREHAINRCLLLEEAVRRGIDIPESDVERFLLQAKQAEHLLDQARKKENIRESIRDACRVEKLIKSVIMALPDPSDDEVLEYLAESGFLPADTNNDPALMQKVVEKTRKLVKNIRQNRALNDFIAMLRSTAVIREGG
ncbi:MAG: hypothetical protein WC299_12935 [Kiritimatiellia bacterium]